MSRNVGPGQTPVLALVAVALLLASSGCVAGPLGNGSDGSTPTPESWDGHSSYETTEVTVIDNETGAELGVITAAIADNGTLRYTGLSETDEMPRNRGMLFVFGSSARWTFVMRNMSFGLDMVFVSANGTITTIHHAPAPGPNEDGGSQQYSGNGKYVLEVNKGWTTNHSVEVGDRLEFELPA